MFVIDLRLGPFELVCRPWFNMYYDSDGFPEEISCVIDDSERLFPCSAVPVKVETYVLLHTEVAEVGGT